MDWTVLQHVIIAIACTGIGYLLRYPVAGAAFGSALFVGREHAQAEYRWIEHLGGHIRVNMPWWGGFDLRVWDWGSLFDWLTPLAVCVVVVLVLKGFKIVEQELKQY
jgi:hypothetical protein